MKKESTEESLNEALRLQRENADLKKELDVQRSVVRDRTTEIIGYKKTIRELKGQMEKLAMTLGVPDDYPTLSGEMEKLICVESDIEILRGQMMKLKNGNEEEIGRAIALGENAISKMRDKEIELKNEIKQLKSRRSVDRYKIFELALEIVKKALRSIIKGISDRIKKFFKFIISKMRGVRS